MHVYFFLCNHYDLNFYNNFVLVQIIRDNWKSQIHYDFWNNLVQFGNIFENMPKSQMHINVYRSNVMFETNIMQ